MNKNNWYRKIPKVDVLLEEEEIQKVTGEWGRTLVMEAIREELADFRCQIEAGVGEDCLTEVVQNLPARICRRVKTFGSANLKAVINGTGTILHTNLGRAPISPVHAARAQEIVSSYSNLEFDLKSGGRGERYSHFEKLLCRITGAESAMAVNNNASSVLLILSALARGGETIVSRGELVEIGGKFRIPDVMEQSGSILREVGCTNKTHYEDYEEAIGEETRMLLKVHTSNYRILGFTESVTAKELAPLARQAGIPLVEDLGSGVFVDLEEYGLSHEPTVQEAVQNGVDVVCFSGDKLLGGPQAGIIVGRRKYIEQLKKHPLTRALRIDKYTAAVLEQCLLEYLWKERAIQNIPVLRMLSVSYQGVRERAVRLKTALENESLAALVEICDCKSQVGGGSLPTEELKSCGVCIVPRNISLHCLEERLRCLPIPIIGRVYDDKFLLDVRTISEDQIPMILYEIKEWQALEAAGHAAEGR